MVDTFGRMKNVSYKERQYADLRVTRHLITLHRCVTVQCELYVPGDTVPAGSLIMSEYTIPDTLSR